MPPFQTEKLNDLKKELANLNTDQLRQICIRMAKYRKENKELLAFILFDSDDPLHYAAKIKSALEEDFRNLNTHYYYNTKTLRKILRTLNRHIKYTASKQVEAELLLWFCHQYLCYADLKSIYKPLKGIFIRQTEKINKLIVHLHEDLQFDYRNELQQIIGKALEKKAFSKKDFNL